MREKELKNLLLLKPKREEIKETDDIKKWLDKFKEERLFDGRKESTIKNDLTRLKVFLDFCYNRLGKSPDEMETSDFVKFFNYLEKERKLSKNTQKRYYDLLKVFYKLMRLKNFNEFAEESKERKRFACIEIRHYDAVDAEILNEILRKIVESNSRTRMRDALIVRLLWDTGARVSEILNLRYKDVDFNEGIIRITNTKNREERKVVCASETLELLRHYCQFNIRQGPEDYLFQNNRGGRVRKDWISEVFRKAVDELKKEGKIPPNKRIVIHSLRHGRAVDLLEKGLPLDVVKEYLGHRSLEVTLFYSHSKERTEKLLKIIRKL
ncbi:integrase family protein [Methanocaldococcus vulcanius M7]|uniref:Integrase family protein n=1 Tax=Methanocaldococcus vulcanius (strain ATCC 700851 / DSM 12094 / M7) TaxID=579137 RepID=C9RFW0_METVM|nr:site-specific integrase [Methanocaldococcus vulcanius]ACX72462.1 integrase family protein [Methanocaldococcus vulcanius M7]